MSSNGPVSPMLTPTVAVTDSASRGSSLPSLNRSPLNVVDRPRKATSRGGCRQPRCSKRDVEENLERTADGIVSRCHDDDGEATADLSALAQAEQWRPDAGAQKPPNVRGLTGVRDLRSSRPQVIP